MLRYAELFAGVGGLSLGLDNAGFECAFHAEIEEFPRRVLKHHWPDTPLYGDVCGLDGRNLVEIHGAIDLLTGGSPCQDLSVAGKRSGMTEGSGTHSSLFYEQMRLWDETEAGLCLWENVLGALSSNNGKDFASVLSAFVGGTVIVPRRDGWRNAGVVSGPRGVAAWRVFDAQWFGVPQRRRRVFVLGSRTPRVDPAEVLLEPRRLPRSLAPSREKRQANPANSGRSPEGEGGVVSFDSLNQSTDEVQHSLRSATGMDGGTFGGILAFGWQNSPSQNDSVSDSITPSLDKSKIPAVLRMVAFGEYVEDGTASAIKARGWKDATDLVVNSLVGFGEFAEGTPPTLRSSGGDQGGGSEALVVGWEDELNANTEMIGTLKARTKSGQSKQGVLTGIPRRLLPIECERLMGWPDFWTAVPDAKGKPASDSARYKVCGNGVVSTVTEWIGLGIREHLGLLEAA